MFLLLICFASAQVDEGLNEQGLSDENSSDAGQSGRSEKTDDSFLDELIGNEPIITKPPSTGQQPHQSTIPDTLRKSATAPSDGTGDNETSHPAYQYQSGGSSDYGQRRETKEPAVSKPVQKPSAKDDGVRSSTTPRINIAALQETPEIPNFSHEKHLKDVGAECVQCHQTLFSETVRGYRVGPSMKEICSQCHNGADAPAEVIVGFSDEKKYVKTHMPLFSHTKHINHTEDCNTCHKDIYGELKKIKIPPPMTICSGCHNNHKANANCGVCHEDPSRLKPRTHSPRWVFRNGHGLDARYNQGQCRNCHVDRECSVCHRGQGSFEVHRPGYKYSHGMDARQRQVNCGFCHSLENGCAKCHVRTR